MLKANICYIKIDKISMQEYIKVIEHLIKKKVLAFVIINLYEVANFPYRLRVKPYFLGSFLRLCGYCYSLFRRDKHVLPIDVIRYLRIEQKQRLIMYFKKPKNNIS